MIREAIDRILKLGEIHQFEIDGRQYTSAGVVPVKLPEPVSIGVHTLTGLRDYLRENPDGLELDTVLVHIVDPKHVKVFSRLTGDFVQRMPYLDACHDMPEFCFGKYMDIETFIVELQAKFVQDEMTAKVLQLLGTLTDDLIRVYADDGVTQEVTAKSGLGRVEPKAVPNPVVLSPYRTFNDIVQPEGRFVLRLKSGNGSGTGRPMVALFEADGGAWQLKAIEFIRTWLRSHIPEEIAILA